MILLPLPCLEKFLKKTMCHSSGTAVSRRGVDPIGTFFGQICPNSPCAFALLKPDYRSTISSAGKMQNHVIACALPMAACIRVPRGARQIF
ncbi:MAG: hypothetical protein DME33_13440 [Verrucomicrobia bacterium]|nr:MAG: hypothetical protein DME33_13440 [Verrucomicrobiota bacterium]